MLQNNFIFQQDGATAHTSHATQDWISQNTPEFIKKDEWPPNSPDLNPLDYHVWGAMLDKFKNYSPRPKDKKELIVVLQSIWNDLHQESIDKAILSFRKRLQAYIREDGGHFEHIL